MAWESLKGRECWRSEAREGRSLGWDYTLEKETATYFSTLAWRIPWTEEPGGLQSMGSQW